MYLVPPQKLIEQAPLSAEAREFISKTRQTIQKICDGQDPRILFIVGPCSIHNVKEGLEYARQFKQLAKEVEESCFLVMRAYIEKPRTKEGWKGLVHDPHLNGSHDISTGLVMARTFLRELAEMGVPAATEFLTPHLVPYIEDCISWGCIGARTSSSQIHRLLASYLSMPVGFKNSVDGNIESAIHAVHFARSPHSFMHICDTGRLRYVRSAGNFHTHIVLRGGLDETNYNSSNVQTALNALRSQELPPRLMIDCSHGNCEKKYFRQKEVFQSVLEQIQKGNTHIFGMMLESNLEAGSQMIPAQLTSLQPGVSITDSCLDFSTTAELITSVSSSVSMTLTQS